VVAAEPYLKTRRVAQALGVSVSTVKRWVDSGMIRAARTVGKHRLIPFSEALRLAREQGFPEANLEVLAGLTTRGPEVGRDQAATVLERLLREGKAAESKAFIHSVYNSGWGGVALADDLIRPVMERIGHGWMVGSLDIYQEHQATLIVDAALRQLGDDQRRVGREERPGPLALGATTEGDPYVLPGLLGELVLRELGWQMRNLGVNLPLRSLAHATVHHRPRLIFLSVSYLKDEAQFVREYRSFYDEADAVGAAVIVGGQALRPDLRSRLIYASYGERMVHLAEFARRLSQPADTSQAGGSGT
jgi:MerR family transcriptional regulator, light-induced transcriptional regulator